MNLIKVDIDQYEPEPERTFFALHTGKNELISKKGVLLTGTAEQWSKLLFGTSVKYRLINCKVPLPATSTNLEFAYPGFFVPGADKLGRR